MKLVYCYCPKFDYFAKSDDDTYTRIDRLNNELPKLQKEIDETAIQFNIYAFKVSKRLPGFRTWVGGRPIFYTTYSLLSLYIIFELLGDSAHRFVQVLVRLSHFKCFFFLNLTVISDLRVAYKNLEEKNYNKKTTKTNISS